MNYLFDFSDPALRRMMPQQGVRQAVLPRVTQHNASWDSVLTPDGRLFFSLCSELTTSEYAKLAEYRYDSNDIVEHFYTHDYLLPHERYIRDSKFHTSMSLKADGTLIMATHTTDKSPCHPAWMPEAYFSSPWEGFPGSTLFGYDPLTKKAANLGIPAPRESVYGAAYDQTHDRFYMLGFMRGHLYCYDCRTGTVEDLGQVTERHTYKLVVGIDQNIYFSTRSGVLQRILVDEKRVENLRIQLPHSADKKRVRSYLCAAAGGPDGKLYIAGQFHDELSVYDPASGDFTVLGRYMDADAFMPSPSNNAYIGAMAFDKDGVLWYLVNGLRHDRGENFKPACVLMYWDLLNGGRPQRIGLAGTPRRAVTTSVGLFIDRDKDRLYMVGTNHADEGPDVTAIDLSVFRRHLNEPGPLSEDDFIDPENKSFTAHAENLAATWRIIDANPATANFKNVLPVRLWNADYAPEETSVVRLAWQGDVLCGLCGGPNSLAFRVASDGTLLDFKPLAAFKPDFSRRLITASKPPDVVLPEGIVLPHYPGRQYLAVPDKCCPLKSGDTLVATKDGWLALVKPNGDVYSLGPVCNNGPVHAMLASGDGTYAYGVAGDKDDLGCVFLYDETRGLRNLGRLVTDGPLYGNAASCELACCALNENQKLLAIGAGDRLGCVYLCELE